MQLNEIINKLHLQVLTETVDYRSKEAYGCYSGDLLSNVMARCQADDLWITVQTHQNVVAVAVLLNLAGIIFVEGHAPTPETLAKAEAEGIVLMGSQQLAYPLGGALYGLGLKRAEP